ncbi:MAG: cell envelope integrity protein TolA [Proteobacteria bacterium]|nr:cell envelope integrity protein TolA [Pseudomonadota bacterium]
MFSAKLFSLSIISSLIFHVALLYSVYVHSEKQPDPELLDEVLDIEVMPVKSISRNQEVLSKAKASSEIKVPEKILPQLPKHVKVVRDEGVRLQEQELPSQQKVKSHKSSQPSRQSTPVISQTERKKREMLKQQALLALKSKRQGILEQDMARRLVKEKARKLKKFSKTLESPESKISATKNAKSWTLDGDSSQSIEIRAFVLAMQKKVGRNYALPEVYKFQYNALKTTVRIVLMRDGTIAKMGLNTSSGDKVFDAMSLEMIKKSQPLPKPPPALIGKVIMVHFDPFQDREDE